MVTICLLDWINPVTGAEDDLGSTCWTFDTSYRRCVDRSSNHWRVGGVADVGTEAHWDMSVRQEAREQLEDAHRMLNQLGTRHMDAVAEGRGFDSLHPTIASVSTVPFVLGYLV